MAAAQPQQGPAGHHQQAARQCAALLQPFVGQSAGHIRHQRTGNASDADQANLRVIEVKTGASQQQGHGGEHHAHRGKTQATNQCPAAQARVAAHQCQQRCHDLAIAGAGGRPRLG